MTNQEIFSLEDKKFSLLNMSELQEVLPIPDVYKDSTFITVSELNKINRDKYFDAQVLKSNSVILSDEASSDDLQKSFDPKKWADSSIFDSKGGLRKDFVETYNKRTEKAAEKYGVKLVNKDPQTGLYLNPFATTNINLSMLYGRGVMGKYGINDAVDIKIKTKKDGVDYVLTMRRPKDFLMPLAVPGGIVDYISFTEQETLENAASRESLEEIGLKLPEGAVLRKTGSYIVADPRNTIFSFIGTTVFEIGVSWEEAINIKKGLVANKGEASDVDFRPVSGDGSIFKDPESVFFASHKYIISS
jgi:ADP-ribose pyrophosphatase YjhB (NUDIX family)